MATVDHNIGGFRRIIENSNKVPSLINREPMANPYDAYNVDIKLLLDNDPDPKLQDGFICGFDQMGGTKKAIR
jgi:hypothetical protein